MRTLVAAVVAVVVVVSNSGCVSTVDTVRRYASRDLQCPAMQIRTREVAPGAFVARGCGRSTMYIDNAAPSILPAREPGRAYVTLRVARNP